MGAQPDNPSPPQTPPAGDHSVPGWDELRARIADLEMENRVLRDALVIGAEKAADLEADFDFAAAATGGAPPGAPSEFAARACPEGFPPAHRPGAEVGALACLQAISRFAATPDLSLEQILAQTAGLLEARWPFGGPPRVAITLGRRVFGDAGEFDRRHLLRSDLFLEGRAVGSVAVELRDGAAGIPESPPEAAAQPFLDAVAERIGAIIARHYRAGSLRRSETRFRKIFEASPDAIAITRLEDGRFLDVNDGFAALSGFRRDEVIGKSSLEVDLWTDPAVRQEFVARLRQKGVIRNFEAQVRLRDGSTTTALISAVLMDLEGQAHIISMSRDMGEFKQAQRALQAAYRFLHIASSLSTLDTTLQAFITEIKSLTGCAAAGIRMLDAAGNLPYAAIDGFCDAFRHLENGLSIHVDRCMCIRVARGEAQAGQPFFTDRGSFFTPSTSRLLRDLAPEALEGLRGNCHRFGYESVALIPVRAENRVIGLIHAADPEENRLPLETVRLLENASLQLGASIQRMWAEEELRRSNERLEERVAARAAEVIRSNEQLKKEIHERERAEARLREQQGMLQAVFDGISDPLILTDRDLRVLMVNRAAVRYFGLSRPEDLVGRTCREVMSHNPAACAACQVPMGVAGGSTVTFEREGFIDPGRQEQVVIYPVTDPGLGGGQAVIRINDITASRLLERQVIQSEKMASLGLLVSSIAHELNNPNSFIAFNVPILREYFHELLPIVDRYADAHPDFEILHMPYAEFRRDAFKLLDNLTHGSQRIDAFLGNLREFVRTHPETTLKWVDLKGVVNRALAICRSKVQKTVRRLEVHLPDDAPEIYSQPGALEQILINLLVNAAQAADKPDSWIRLTVAQIADPAPQWRIQVADNGCGMDEETRLKIFEPFFSTKLNEGGSGLGLYVCRRLLREIGGLIHVESRPGEGSAFTVTLPDRKPPPEPR